ncbi:MAG TPA: hypothetical protein VF517_16370 [Thermoleophilaceae bacterium]
MAITIFAAIRLRDTYVGDAAVYLPYARNAGDGHPFQFNLGEFSSGSTSPLWSLILGVPFLAGFELMGAKAMAALFAAIGFLTTLLAARHFSRSWAAAGVAALFALGTMTFPAVSLYESGLVVTLSALALLAGDHVLGAWRATDAPRAPAWRTLAPLVAVWAALPLARPDAVILVGAHALALLAFAPVERRRALRTLAPGLAVAALPALAYFGYSVAELDTFSTSSQARTFALREGARDWLGPLFLEDGAVRELFASPWIFGLLPALAGLWLLWRRAETRWAAAYGALAVVGYVLLLTFVAPGIYDTPRYLLPLVPVVACGVAVLLARPAQPLLAWAALGLAALAIGGSAADELRDNVRLARSIGIDRDEVFERDVVARIDALAEPGDAVLAYEVQLRYFLRQDVKVFSQDGITDPRVAAYREDKDMTGYLMRYRPEFWIADRNAQTRQYTDGTILERALVAYRHSPRPAVRVFDGIRFELVARRNRPLALGFGGWEFLFRLSYPPPRGGRSHLPSQ